MPLNPQKSNSSLFTAPTPASKHNPNLYFKRKAKTEMQIVVDVFH